MRCRWLLVTLLAACQSVAGGGGGGGDDQGGTDGGGSGSGSGANETKVFAATTTKVTVEIDYETGQEPYTGTTIGFGDTWAPTLSNIDRLFAGTRVLTIPTTLADMENVGAIDDEELTIADIAALSVAHRQVHDSGDTKTYWVIFVSGHFADANGPNTAVLGISIGDTITMFKDVIRSTGQIGNPNVVRFVEQSTMIHELAHSIGLVDNGVPMLADHKDETHGAHCTNPNCVEYWLNEGANDARDFAINKLLTGNTILFDNACLADVDALTGGL